MNRVLLMRVADPLGLYEVVFDITKNPHSAPQQICGSPIACTVVGAKLDTCGCKCDQDIGLVFANVTLKIEGTMHIYSGPFGALKKTSRTDKSVTNAQTAAQHEYNYHIYPAMAAIDPIIKDFEKKGFASLGACQTECVAVNWKITNLFVKTLHATQITENQ